MTQISDSLFLGPVATLSIGLSGSGGTGVGPAGRMLVYDIVPLALNASALAASQSPVAAALILSAGTGVTAIVDAYGVTRYTFDVPRCVTVTSGGNDTGIAFLITGYDFYGSKMSQLLTGASASAATTTKAFFSVISIVPNGAVASTVTAGTSNTFGLPVNVIDAGYISSVGWNNTLAENAGTFVAGVQTSPATTTTGDVRGTFAPTGSAANGTIRMVMQILLSEAQVGKTGSSLTGVLGQPQV